MITVVRKLRSGLPFLFLLASVTAVGQTNTPPATAQAASPPPSPAQALYRELRTVGLDPERVYNVRDAVIEREDLHVSLDDGTIAFTRSVDGHVTGAFFVGEGEVLLAPPNRVERISLTLFTGAAILEEKFTNAYFRFNDDLMAELQPSLRPTEDAPAFAERWTQSAESLAESDALRLLTSFLTTPDPTDKFGDHMFRARLGGTRHGIVEVSFDTRASEQISVGQMNYKNGVGYFDYWTSFPMRSARRAAAGEEPNPDYVRITGYRIAARIQPPTELEAEATVNLETTHGGRSVIVFELSRFLKLKEVSAGGTPIEFLQNEALEGTALARRGNDLVALVFPAPLPVGRKFELRFVYAGSVLSEAGGGLMYVGARGAWYPHRGLSMTDFQMQFRYPAGWTLVATGKRVSQESTGEEQVSGWKSERPIPLAGFNLGKYVRSSAKAGDVVVESYAAQGMESSFPKPRDTVVLRPNPLRDKSVVDVYPAVPARPASHSEAVAESSARAIEYLAKRLGPFPYSSLALSQMPGPNSQGWPGLVFLSSYVYLSPEQRAQTRIDPFDALLYAELVPVHETAHQWWGDSVLWKSYRDQWLVEALSNYCALLTLEKDHATEVHAILEKYRRDLLEKDSEGQSVADAGPVALGTRLSSSRFPHGFDTISYGRGTWMFHMLRHLLRDPRTKGRGEGDDVFFQALRTLLERFAGRTITTRDVQRAFEEVLPESARYEGRKSLDWFFDGWVSGIDIPRLELDSVRFVRKGSTTTVTGKVLQKDAAPDLITAVPLYASIPGRQPVFVGRVFVDGEESTFRFTVSPATKKLLLDPYQTVLTRP